MTNGFGNMNKLIPKYVEDEDEIFPIKLMTKEEAEEILAIMLDSLKRRRINKFAD